MKKLRLSLLPLALLIVGGCSNQGNEIATDGDGQVTFACTTQSSVEELTRATSTYELPTALIPQEIDQFSLYLTGSYTDADTGEAATYEATYETLESYHSELPMLGAGNYTATISLGDIDAEAMDAPCYEGTHSFEVVARKTSSETITTTLINSVVRMQSSDWFDNYYTDAAFTLTTSTGNSFDFVPNDEQLLFLPPNTTLTLSGSATKVSNGVAVTFPATTIGTTTARTIVTLVVEAGSVGGGSISITIDDTPIEITPIEIELNPEV